MQSSKDILFIDSYVDLTDYDKKSDRYKYLVEYFRLKQSDPNFGRVIDFKTGKVIDHGWVEEDK